VPCIAGRHVNAIAHRPASLPFSFLFFSFLLANRANIGCVTVTDAALPADMVMPYVHSLQAMLPHSLHRCLRPVHQPPPWRQLERPKTEPN
jgi:hypothetical protein